MSLFKKPDITGWSYSVVVQKNSSIIYITDPDGKKWGRNIHREIYKASTSFDRPTFHCRSITQRDIDKYAKKMIRKCLSLYNYEKARDAKRADNYKKEF